MRFNVPCKAFYSAVSAVSKVINPKNTLRILDNFLLEVSNDTLVVTGSDTDSTLTARVAITDVEGSGRFCVIARRLVDLLKELPDQGITFKVNDQNFEVEIEYTGGHYNLHAVDGKEFPSFK